MNRPKRRSCADCGAPVNIWDLDELALCADCLEERRELEEACLRGEGFAEEQSVAAPDEGVDIFGPLRFKRMVQSLRDGLTPRERAVLDTDPATARQATQNEIAEAERRALAKLRVHAPSPKNEAEKK